MKAEQPAEGILKTGTWPGAKSFHIECNCTSADHAVNMWIEVDSDKETQDVQVGFYVDTWTPFWDKKFSRLRAAWDILVYGCNRQEHHLLLTKQAALNFAETIKREVKEMDHATRT